MLGWVKTMKCILASTKEMRDVSQETPRSITPMGKIVLSNKWITAFPMNSEGNLSISVVTLGKILGIVRVSTYANFSNDPFSFRCTLGKIKLFFRIDLHLVNTKEYSLQLRPYLAYFWGPISWPQPKYKVPESGVFKSGIASANLNKLQIPHILSPNTLNYVKVPVIKKFGSQWGQSDVKGQNWAFSLVFHNTADFFF